MPEQTNIPSNPEIISNMQHEGIVTEPLLPGYPRFPMLMFSSSHMTEHHHFREALQDVWTTRFSDNPCVHYPEVDARPGRRLDNQFVAEFANKIETLTEPTVLLVNLGDNNLTSRGYRGLRHNCAQILTTAVDILELHSKSEHLLMFLGLMPRWSHTRLQVDQHVRVEKDLFDAISGYINEGPAGPRLACEPSTRWFMVGDHLVRDNFENDGVHLTRQGAQNLARGCLVSANQLVANYRAYLRELDN